MGAARVVVVGGGGFFGRYLVADILERTDAHVVVASRHAKPSSSPRTSSVAVDLRDRSTLERVLADANVVVHCAGPFERLPIEVLDAAVATRTPYVDIAENRAFARLAAQRHEAAVAAGIPVLTGASVTPGLELVLARSMTDTLDTLDAVTACIAPGSRRPRGPGMYQTILYGAGRRFDEPTPAGTVTRHGWTIRRRVEFPPPLGRRWNYLVYGMADLDVVPAALGPCSVQFWAGSEMDFADILLLAAARIRARTGHPALERYSSLVRAVSWLLRPLGRDDGGVVVEVTGTRAGHPAGERTAIVARSDGGRIAVLLAGVGVEVLLEGKRIPTGVLPADAWTTAYDITAACAARHLSVSTASTTPSGTWLPWTSVRLDEAPGRRR